MKKFKTLSIVFTFLISTLFAQNTTINKNKAAAVSLHKVMLVPFEPKLYNSEIDYSINKETKLSSKDIKHKFRDGMNEQLFKALKAVKYTVVDLMEDTVKYKKEVAGIYQYLTYEFVKIPDQNNYKPPTKDKKQTTVDKGQLNIETNADARFMNAKVTNPKLVPLLYGKYKTDIFIFINQLDIKAGMVNADYTGAQQNNNRKIVVHYTVYTYDAKEINSGIAEQEFPSDVSNPNKIIDKYFSKVAETISARVTKALAVK